MADFNSIGVSGRLGNDPDMRYTADGMAILSFNLANGVYKKGAENNTQTTWYRCTLFGKRAETLNEMLSKGSRVIVNGTHSLRDYTDKDGNARTSNEIAVNELTLLDSKNSNAGENTQSTRSAPQKPTQQRTAASRNVPQAVDDDTSLPF